MKDKSMLSEQKSKVRTQLIAGVINESQYDKLMQQISDDYKKSVDYEQEREETIMLESRNKEIAGLSEENIYLDEAKWAKNVEAKKGKMHDLLGIPKDKTISSKYTSGAKLAQDLLKKVGDEKKVAGMLAYAANINSKEDVFDRALAYLNENQEVNTEVVYEIYEGDVEIVNQFEQAIDYLSKINDILLNVQENVDETLYSKISTLMSEVDLDLNSIKNKIDEIIHQIHKN